MNPITYFLALIVSLSGILAGAVLNFMAKEEMKTGKRYFILMKKVLLILMIIVFINYFDLNIFLRILLYSLSIILLSLKDLKSYFVYPAMGLLFHFSSLNPDLLLMQSTLIFIYGLPAGSLFVEKEKNVFMAVIKTAFYHVSFIVMPLVFFLLFYLGIL